MMLFSPINMNLIVVLDLPSVKSLVPRQGRAEQSTLLQRKSWKRLLEQC